MEIRTTPVTTHIVEIAVEEILVLGDDAYTYFCDLLENEVSNICGHFDWDLQELEDCFVRITQPMSQEEVELLMQQLRDKIIPLVHRSVFEKEQSDRLDVYLSKFLSKEVD